MRAIAPYSDPYGDPTEAGIDLAQPQARRHDPFMAKRVPIDCKRLKPHHVQRLSAAELKEVFVRIEMQSQQLNRARRVVYDALDRLGA